MTSKLTIPSKTPHVVHKYEFPEFYRQSIEKWLQENGFSLKKLSQLASAIINLSDYYHSRQHDKDIWSHKEWLAAYLVYFFPLNFIRLRAVTQEALNCDFFSELTHWVDFGSGLGTFQHALHSAAPNLQFKSSFIEISPYGRQLHEFLNQELSLEKPCFSTKVTPQPEVSHPTLLSMSYSYNESPLHLQDLKSYEALLIVEPSTRFEGRSLMTLREQLIAEGFYIWAPCTHQFSCPLLKHSQKDWCHQRIFSAMPDWFLELETHLPMNNDTLTFSYLMAKKTPPPHNPPNLARVIGDTLKEKGKTRQAICRNSEREFLSWLKRDQKPPFIPRGQRLLVPSNSEKKGQEIRNPNFEFYR